MTSPINSKQIATSIITLKHAYRTVLRVKRMATDEIRYCRRQIKLTQENPFFKHRHTMWQSRIDELQALLVKGRPLIHQIQELLTEGIRMFDACGPAPVHVYAALLSTHHRHVEQAMSEGAINLAQLVTRQVENGAHRSDAVTDHALLHDAVTEFIIRELCHNKELERTAHELIQDMALETLGRPLREYRITSLSNGQTVIKPMPPNLKLVGKH